MTYLLKYVAHAARTLALVALGACAVTPDRGSAPLLTPDEPAPRPDAVTPLPTPPPRSLECNDAAGAPLAVTVKKVSAFGHYDEVLLTGHEAIDAYLRNANIWNREQCADCERQFCLPLVNDGTIFSGMCVLGRDEDVGTTLVAKQPFIFVRQGDNFVAATPAEVFATRDVASKLKGVLEHWEKPHGLYFSPKSIVSAGNWMPIEDATALLSCAVRPAVERGLSSTYGRGRDVARCTAQDRRPLTVTAKEDKSDIAGQPKRQELTWFVTGEPAIDDEIGRYMQHEQQAWLNAPVGEAHCAMAHRCVKVVSCRVTRNDGRMFSALCDVHSRVGFSSERTTFNFIHDGGWQPVTLRDIVDTRELQLRSGFSHACPYFGEATSSAAVSNDTLFTLSDTTLSLHRKDYYACQEVPLQELAPHLACQALPLPMSKGQAAE